MSDLLTKTDGGLYTYPLEPCEPWCTGSEGGPGHPSNHPSDRRCWSDDIEVPNSLGQPEMYGETDNERWAAPRLAVCLVRQAKTFDNQVLLHVEDGDREVYMTPAEALALANALLAKVDQLGAEVSA